MGGDYEWMPALTFATMGTVVSLRLEDADAVDLVETVFHRWDEQFSLYREDSELSRIARGDIRLTEASQSLRACYALALHWCERTQGVFTPHRADDVIDLSGVVKALAIAEAGAALTARGSTNWSINAGGDVLVSGDAGHPEWSVGIVDPSDRGELIASVPLRHPLRAVATSGSAERGEHIWTALNGDPSPFRQVSVFAADIVTADVLATAIVAGGETTLNEMTERFAIDVLAVRLDGQLLATPGLRRTV
ncbi:FAD:protein FMN transferase [Cryobacterium sp. Y62]|uniref:FAD:protein FMN transferase n=1 Tax=Cryobacterium sp. Y62 TaxID=2048284 RepID=UPI001E640DF1|nr:FAD:protein FMN transferase [Cryobacterium sp. Y62]